MAGGMQLSCSSRDAKRPNVIFLLLDAARADRLQCSGYDRDVSPEMDALAAEGALFLNHFANATYTLSSVPSYFYSRYCIKGLAPADRRIPLQDPEELFRKIDDEAISLPEVFRINGYRTALFTTNPYFLNVSELVKEFDGFYEVYGERSGYGSAEKTFDRISSWIEEQRTGLEPFFIYAHLMDTHFPHERKAECEPFIRPDYDRPERFDWRGYPRSQKLGPGGLTYVPEDFPDADRRYLDALYDGDIKYTDTRLGRFIQFLKNENLLDETLLVIASDHGEHLGEHDLIGHEGPPWDSVIRVPLILRLPGRITPGTRISGLTENVDILPTLVSLLDLAVPEGKRFDGKAVLGSDAPAAEGKDYVLAPDFIRSPRYKYMLDRASGREFLYDLSLDPEEETNLVRQEPDRAGELKKTMNDLLSESRSRYNRAVSRETPGLPFAIAPRYFQLSSSSPIETIKQYRYPSPSDELVSRIQREPLWIHNESEARYFILGFNQAGLAPLFIEFPLPNGRYRVMVTCLAGKEVRGYPMSLFRMGVGDAGNDRGVLVDTSGGRENGEISLGEILVEDNQFRAVLYPYPESSWSSILYFGFEPLLPGASSRDLSDPKAIKRLKQLKTLGYMQ